MKAGKISEQGTVNYMVNKVLADFSNKIREYNDGEQEQELEHVSERHWISDIAVKHD
jgi:hypothetical protein